MVCTLHSSHLCLVLLGGLLCPLSDLLQLRQKGLDMCLVSRAALSQGQQLTILERSREWERKRRLRRRGDDTGGGGMERRTRR